MPLRAGVPRSRRVGGGPRLPLFRNIEYLAAWQRDPHAGRLERRAFALGDDQASRSRSSIETRTALAARRRSRTTSASTATSPTSPPPRRAPDLTRLKTRSPLGAPGGFLARFFWGRRGRQQRSNSYQLSSARACWARARRPRADAGRCRRGGDAAVPLLPHGPERREQAAQRPDAQEGRRCDGRRRRRRVADPGRLHVPRPVRRPRPDLRQDERDARQDVSPVDLLQARSPSLDLDSLYGAGPTIPSRRSSTKDGLHLKMGKTVASARIAGEDGFDLPRGAGSTRRRSARRSSRTRATTRTSRSPRRTSR